AADTAALRPRQAGIDEGGEGDAPLVPLRGVAGREAQVDRCSADGAQLAAGIDRADGHAEAAVRLLIARAEDDLQIDAKISGDRRPAVAGAGSAAAIEIE